MLCNCLLHSCFHCSWKRLGLSAVRLTTTRLGGHMVCCAEHCHRCSSDRGEHTLAAGDGSSKLQSSCLLRQLLQGARSSHFTLRSLHRLHPLRDFFVPSWAIIAVLLSNVTDGGGRPERAPKIATYGFHGSSLSDTFVCLAGVPMVVLKCSCLECSL